MWCARPLQRAVSGLKAGLTAGEDDVEKVEFAAKELESICGPVDLSNHLEKLQGKWKLIYSSAFSSRTVGGTRLFRPFVRALPITVSQVCSIFNFYITYCLKFEIKSFYCTFN